MTDWSLTSRKHARNMTRTLFDQCKQSAIYTANIIFYGTKDTGYHIGQHALDIVFIKLVPHFDALQRRRVRRGVSVFEYYVLCLSMTLTIVK